MSDIRGHQTKREHYANKIALRNDYPPEKKGWILYKKVNELMLNTENELPRRQ